MQRQGSFGRTTRETDIAVQLNLDGRGNAAIETGIGFFDHMLTAFAKHSLIDLTLRCKGDLAVDGHHTVEDCGLCIGAALNEALGRREGIARFASAHIPMDEALAFCAIDLSGRPYLKFDAQFSAAMIGGYDAQLTCEFFRALSTAAGITLHLTAEGDNAHHITEAIFKAFARALRFAAQADERMSGEIPSTKGVL